VTLPSEEEEKSSEASQASGLPWLAGRAQTASPDNGRPGNSLLNLFDTTLIGREVALGNWSKIIAFRHNLERRVRGAKGRIRVFSEY
jgi:hypothetical protein